MLNSVFANNYPFIYNYFSTMLDLVKSGKRNFPQAIIFEGNDTQNQLLFALELARILNCTSNAKKDCDCINCGWIKSFSHPSVNIVSQIHFKGDDDETKTLISAKQAKNIENSLLLSSDYYRFFVFFSSKSTENYELDNFRALGYKSNFNYTIEPLNYQTFHTAALNALLKSVEEPPSKTTFVFLTKSKEDILPTITSRCLVFKFSGKNNFDKLKNFNIFLNYQNLNLDSALDFSQFLLDYIKQNGISPDEILDDFLIYLKNLLKSNIDDEILYLKIRNDIEIVNHAIKQIKANVSDKIALEAMALKIARGY